MRTKSKDKIYKLNVPYLGLTKTDSDERELEITKETIERPMWKEAMDKEFKAFMSNQTWKLVPYRGQENIIDSKCIFKIKLKEDDSNERRNARLVAKAFQQTTGLEFDETFILRVKLSTLRVILTIAMYLNLES